MSLKESKFCVESNSSDNGFIITIQSGLDRKSIASFIPKSEMYSSGLQKSYEDIVNIEELADSFANILNELIRGNFFTIDSYSMLCNLYSKFLQNFKTYSDILNFMGSVYKC